MQATYELKTFPFQIALFVCGVLCAAILGAAGGYWLKGLDHPGTAAAATVTTGKIATSYVQAGRPSSVYDAAANRQASMVGENARQDAASLTATQPSLVGENARQEVATASQPSLVGENGRVEQSAEKIRESHRR